MTKFLAVCKTIRKNEKFKRAALVSSMDGLQDALCVPYKEGVNLYALVCLHPFEGVSGQQWAARHLFGGGSSAMKKLTKFEVEITPIIVKEESRSIRAEFERSCDPRMIGLGSKETRLCNIL